jgi:hypothetical protein
MVSEEYAAFILRTEVIERYKYYWNILPQYSGSKTYRDTKDLEASVLSMFKTGVVDVYHTFGGCTLFPSIVCKNDSV